MRKLFLATGLLSVLSMPAMADVKWFVGGGMGYAAPVFSDDVDDLIDNIKNHCSNNIYNKIDLIECNTNKDRIYNIVEEILIKDMIKKYNDGVWDGIVYKIAKKTWKNNKIML